MKKGYKLCPYCGEEIKKSAIKCDYCGSVLNLTGEKSNTEEPKNGEQCTQTSTDWFDRLLFLIPNIIILGFILRFIRTMIGTIDYGINPRSIMYKHPIYFKAYSILSIISVFVGIFMLSIPTRKKYIHYLSR